MKYAVGLGLGTAIGTLLYTGFLSDAQQFDWGRALFVGLISGLMGAVVSLASRKKNSG
jgi:hypothetical protein